MLDGFVLSHRLVIIQGRRARVRSFVFDRIIPAIWREKLDLVPDPIFRQLRDANMQAMGVEIHIGEMVRKFARVTNQIERRLLEMILLHRLNRLYATIQPQDPAIGRAIAITGAMHQDRLALLLLDIDDRQHEKIYRLDEHSEQKNREWHIQFLGACAMVRVIQALETAHVAYIYLTNTLDDADLGVDLFVSIGQKDFAVSIKSYDTPRLMTVRSFSNRPLQLFKREPQVEHGQMIYDGALLAKERYEIPFIPVLVIVGRNGNLQYDLSPHSEDAVAFRHFFNEYAGGRCFAQIP